MLPLNSATSIEALSGICGSISIACWVVVFSPQIIENFRRSSADGLSLEFLIVWLAGDVFNIIGAVMQGVLPTMVILAVYYTIADIVLLGQCLYYRGLSVPEITNPPEPEATEATRASSSTLNATQTVPSSERTPLLHNGSEREHNGSNGRPATRQRRESHTSVSSLRRHIMAVDGTHLSPAVPLRKEIVETAPRPSSTFQIIAFNTFSITLVCAAGILGWYVSATTRKRHHKGHDLPKQDSSLQFDITGQIFGYLCALFYLASRIPQLLLNWRRKSTEGVSLLFFLFACIGNLTYVLSIFAFSPVCQGKDGKCLPGERRSIYGRYMAVNASWLLGSLGTLFMDLAIFSQFIMYRNKDESDNF
ncbi:seven transmembrane protein 1 [Nannizzia gypsea CBS 118893]|uniref:Seven transmembrane protein 1 n=1 Tax=Arthroderma gypseum (strain ATCC MYA-4604 / CBS 118893) TaxID=535722 RepID=E4USA0_ARTGP|nr:seven transmembrane protein 1 [Nannizzia gypsea CBS 118893]EFR01304.1 seven transmembrane protein 1 [Nannizzia gypsea CBS 118893]